MLLILLLFKLLTNCELCVRIALGAKAEGPKDSNELCPEFCFLFGVPRSYELLLWLCESNLIGNEQIIFEWTENNNDRRIYGHELASINC